MLATLRLLLVLLLPLAPVGTMVFLGPAVAQEAELPDYATWQTVVDRVELAIENDRASDDAFVDLRVELQGWRDTFAAARTVNASRIRTVEAQINALGPRPEEGSTESPSVAELRRTLEARLDTLSVPQRSAEVAYNRAEALIAEIDQLLRRRDQRALLVRGPSPLSPSAWQLAWRELGAVDRQLLNELGRSLDSPAQRAIIESRLPAAAFFFLLGSLIVLFGRRWIERLTQKIRTRQGQAGYQLLAFLVSLGQVLVPFGGLVVAVISIYLLNVGGSLVQSGVSAIAEFVVAILAALWISTSVFPKQDHVSSPLPVSPAYRREGRLYSIGFGLIVGFSSVLDVWAEGARLPENTVDLLRFPLVIASAYLFFRLSILFRNASASLKSEAAEDEQTESALLSRVLAILRGFLLFCALASPFFASFGYANMAELLVVPPILSLAMVAVIAILHVVFKDIWALVTGKSPEESNQALAPVLATLFLSLASLPVFALIWGIRAAEIGRAWALITDGFDVGGTRIGLNSVLTIVAVFLLGAAITRLIQATLRTTVLPRTAIDTGGRNAITAGVGYVGMGIAAIAAITAAGINLSGFALFASALSVGIGFGLQTIVSNFVSGLILLAERPISEGDWIEVNGQMGVVKNISVRATVIQTFDRSDLIIPNSDLVAGTVTNYTKGNTIGRVIVDVGVGYDSDPDKVESILHEVCQAHPLVVLNPPPAVFFRGFGDNALLYDARCIIRDVNFKLRVASDLNHEILRRFREENILIPFPQRDVWLRSPGDTSDIRGAQMREDYGSDPLSGDSAAIESDDVASLSGSGEIPKT